ncbi:hypothetical protein A9302_24700 [Salmonella enterica]|nr:hypothetical protein [Salmonella enterica]
MDESRKQFESVIGGKCWSVQKTDSGSYVHERVHLMWMAWRESRAAIEIELLDINQYLAELENKTLSLAFRRLAEGVRAGDITTIRAAGIKVKE